MSVVLSEPSHKRPGAAFERYYAAKKRGDDQGALMVYSTPWEMGPQALYFDGYFHAGLGASRVWQIARHGGAVLALFDVCGFDYLAP
jgi:hypothetical protein